MPPALSAIYAGATVCAWYPITPSTSVAESFEGHLKRMRRDKDGKLLGAIVQAEDELAAIGVVIGGAWNGARSFTATSGPGISLMSEFLGLAYVAELPLVLFNIQRGGPSTGMPTRTQQSDILSCAYASHGDTKHVLLFPSDPAECFSMGADAFDLAERLQTPVIVMSDLDIGMNEWVCDRPDLGRQPGSMTAARCSMPPRSRASRTSRARTGAATSISTATAFPTARCLARIRPRAPISRAAPATTKWPAIPRMAASTSASMDRVLAQVPDRGEAGAEARDHHPRREAQDGHHLLRRQYAGRA